MKINQTILFFLIICMVVSCEKDNHGISKEDELTNHLSSKHFDYYYSSTDYVIIDTSWQEKYYEWLMDTLNLESGIRLEYYKYRDRDHIKRMIGEATNGIAEVGTNRFHTIWKVDNHESVHIIVTQQIGHPPAIFNEGIAVAHQADYYKFPDFIPKWNNQDFNLLSKNFKQTGKIPSLDNLLGRYSFWEYDSNITYPVSGSFVSFLIRQYGLLKMKEFFGICKFEDSKDKLHSDFLQTYGVPIETAWSDWENFITSYNEE